MQTAFGEPERVVAATRSTPLRQTLASHSVLWTAVELVRITGVGVVHRLGLGLRGKVLAIVVPISWERQCTTSGSSSRCSAVTRGT